MVRHGLSALLSQQPGFVVAGLAGTGREAIQLFAELRPDVVLMDGILPDIHGVDATQSIVEQFPDAHILILTINDTEEDIHKAMKAGALGYMTKSSEENETLFAIREVAAGRRFLPPHLARKLTIRQIHSSLSEREVEVIHLVAKGCTNKEIASHLGLSESSVKTYLARIFTKLGASDRTQAVTMATQKGILRN